MFALGKPKYAYVHLEEVWRLKLYDPSFWEYIQACHVLVVSSSDGPCRTSLLVTVSCTLGSSLIATLGLVGSQAKATFGVGILINLVRSCPPKGKLYLVMSCELAGHNPLGDN